MLADHAAPTDLRIENADLPKHPVERYAAVQLHERNARCWAVVGEPDGAIAETEAGALVMRLTAEEAEAVARAMNARLANVVADGLAGALRMVLSEATAPALRAAV